ncbi:Glycosyltransferase [Olavius algarvensis Delta 1 endosymbiont]|nr:Glycosyltransferase [Olavius algarvensis Delta 1 endosymbiont]
MEAEFIDPLEYRYQKERIAHWDYVSEGKQNPRRPGVFYHKLLQRYYIFISSPGLRTLELGCGHGDLLASLKPSLGVGVDFSYQMLSRAVTKYPHLNFIQADVHQLEFKEKFDVIILSDLVNDLWDVQHVLNRIRQFCHPGTRLVMNFFNNLWRIPLALVRRMGLGAEFLEQNWFAPHDIINLLELSGFEIVHHRPCVLLPLQVPFLSSLANRYLVNFPPFSWFALTNLLVARPAPSGEKSSSSEPLTVSVIIPARNEAGHIEDIVKRVPKLGDETELVFVEGHSTDNTYESIRKTIESAPERKCRLFRQRGQGKGDAVRLGFTEAEGQLLMILDADMTVPPEDLPRFVESIVSGKGDFINGVRLVYPMENQSMRFFNILGNKFFSLAFSWLLGQPLKDTLCGTKVLWKRDYERIADNRSYFGNFDPFGDFDLLFGAAKLNLKIVEMPIRYRSRTYGSTNIDRWRHGWLLIKMVLFAARRIKFI